MSSSDSDRPLASKLNSSTPLAPADADEIRSRIEAVQASPPGSDEPRQAQQGQQETSGERHHARTGHLVQKLPEPPPENKRVDFSDSQKLISQDRRIESLTTASTLARIRAEQADQLRQEQQSRIFSATSREGSVTASVDGTGQLLALDIDDDLLLGPDSGSTGSHIVDAVTAATAESIKEFSAPDWSSL